VHAVDQALRPPCVAPAGGAGGRGRLAARSDVQEERKGAVKVSGIVEIGGLHSDKQVRTNPLA
jgi:hypothetical protein